jgi:hypothetical protein
MPRRPARVPQGDIAHDLKEKLREMYCETVFGHLPS